MVAFDGLLWLLIITNPIEIKTYTRHKIRIFPVLLIVLHKKPILLSSWYVGVTLRCRFGKVLSQRLLDHFETL